MLNLRSVDLNLLPVFEAAYEERSLSRAAVRLAMTQSAVSHALSRLRTVFRDELFVRQARGVAPTPAADIIYAKVRGSLASVRESITEMRGFDPQASTRNFFLSAAHPLGPMIALRLRERLSRVAPGVGVAFSTRSRPIELERAMREGRVDAAIDWLPLAVGAFREAVLFDDGVVAMGRRGNPALRQVRSMKDLAACTFVTLRPRVEGENPVPGLEAWRRLDLHVALHVSELLEVFMVASQSDLLGLIPRSMSRFARDTFDLVPLAVAPKVTAVPIRLVWSSSRDADLAHTFLRKQIVMASQDVVGKKAR
jgi:DNA-binding transcriptional LysR family regulator